MLLPTSAGHHTRGAAGRARPTHLADEEAAVEGQHLAHAAEAAHNLLHALGAGQAGDHLIHGGGGAAAQCGVNGLQGRPVERRMWCMLPALTLPAARPLRGTAALH